MNLCLSITVLHSYLNSCNEGDCLMLIHLPPVGDDTQEGNLSAPGEHAEAEPGAARREGRSCLGDTVEDAGVSSGSGWAVQVGCL